MNDIDDALAPQADIAVRCPAPWQDVPEIVVEVEALRDRFAADELSVANVLCDAHDPDARAFVTVDAALQTDVLTFGVLADESKRLASALRERGIVRGSRVGVLMGKSRQLPIVLLAIWRLGAVHVPLFTAFASPAIASRVNGARADLIVADTDQLPKLAGSTIPVLHAGKAVDGLIKASEPLAESVAVGSAGLFIQLYTSGTTGTPKAMGVPAGAIGAFIAYMEYGLNVTSTDVFWNAADPGWAYGLYFGVVGPLATGRANILLSSGFSAELSRRVIDELGVTNLAAALTVYRAMKKDGVRIGRRLRAASSAGEPLTPDVTTWAPDVLGTEVRDHWGQTEKGVAIVNPWDPRLRGEVSTGSMGSAMPGFVAGTVGSSIALAVAESPLMWFTGYVDAPEQTRERFTEDGAWYLTGDVGRAQGSDLYFASRDDDVILAAGYRIAPFDIESIIVADPAVAEVAVVGRPDDVRGEVVEAFVVLDSAVPVGDLQRRIVEAVRNGYGAHAYPRRVHVVDALPKTPSGKIQRFVLRSMPEDELTSAAAS